MLTEKVPAPTPVSSQVTPMAPSPTSGGASLTSVQPLGNSLKLRTGSPIPACRPTASIWLASLFAENKSARVAPVESATLTPMVYMPAVSIPGYVNVISSVASPACVAPVES